MAYTKLSWVNNQTKLNANNMNRIEQGVHDLDAEITNIKQLQENQSTLLTQLEETIANKQATLVSGSNIKTLNGSSILGEGDIEIEAAETVQYTELASGSLDSLINTGIYKITAATDIPNNTSASGLLQSTKLTNNLCLQQWISNNSNAIRLLNIENLNTAFYVNDVMTEPIDGVVNLQAGGSYILNGTLIGKLEIGTAEDTPNGYTKLTFNNVNIKSNGETAVNYLPASKKLLIDLYRDSVNYIVVEDSISDTSDFGAIHSNNNLTITGTGYLGIRNNKGHGIKGSELLINGLPHIYIDAIHDAIHGGSLLKITGGVFYIEHANDAISSSEGADNTGAMIISGGKFIINTCTESAFQGKSTLGVKKIYGDTEITLTGPITGEAFSVPALANSAAQFKLYNTITINNPASISIPETIALECAESQPVVIFAPLVGVQETIYPTGNTYNLTYNNSQGIYRISGNFSGYYINVSATKVDIDVLGIYYHDDSDDTGAFINYNVNSKRLKLKLAEDSINYIYKKNGYCIKSLKNIQITSKGDLFVYNTDGYGIYAPSGDTLLAGDGSRYIQNSKYGVLTSLLILGEDLDDIEEYEDGIKTPATSDDAVYINNNTDYDVYVLTRINSSNAEQAGMIIATQYHTGISIIDNIIYHLDSNPNIFNLTDKEATIISQSGTVLTDVQNVTYESSPLLYVKNTELIETNILKYTEPVEYYDTIPQITAGDVASGWTVYSAQTQLSDAYVPIATYNALLTQVNAITPKKVTFNYGENMVDTIAVLKYVSDTAQDIEPTEVEDGDMFYSRDGDFGYTSLDSEGQVNFSYIASNNNVIIPTITPDDGFKNFKSPFVTCKDNIYRITKITDNLVCELNAVDETTLPAHTVTYNIVTPEGYAGTLPTVNVYRCSDARLFNFAPNTLTFTEGSATEYTYSKDTGYRSAASFKDGEAQINFTITNVPEGYSCTATISGIKGTDYNKFEQNVEDRSYWQATKVGADITITLTLAIQVEQVDVTYVEGTYIFGTNVAVANIGADLRFEFYHRPDKQNPTILTPPETLPTAEESIDKIESIIIDGSPIDLTTLTAAMVAISGKKATITLPGNLITGDVVITLKTIE